MKLVALVAAGGLLAGCAHDAAPRERPPLPVRCVAVSREPWTDRVDLRGLVTAAPDKHAMVAAQVGGRITKLLVSEGDSLRAGSVIAELERQPLDDVLAQAEAQVAQAEVAVESSEISRRRAEHLVETGVGSRQQLDDATARHQTAVSAAAAARAAAAVSRRGVKRTAVTSPIPGVVIRIFRRPGELVDGTAATVLAEVADPSDLELTATAGAADVVHLSRGQRATVRFALLGDDQVDAEVRAVAPAVDSITGLGSVRLSLRPKSTIPIGVYGEASIVVGERSNVLTLPSTALRTGAGGTPEAVLCGAGRARTRSLRVGARLADRVEIVDGVRDGDRVIGDAPVGIADGAPIRVLP